MSLVTFLGIWFVREAHIPLATVGLAFLGENLLRGFLAPLFVGLSDRIGRTPLPARGVGSAFRGEPLRRAFLPLFVGGLSTRFGRKPLLVASAAATAAVLPAF